MMPALIAAVLAQAAAADISYRADGGEPFWSLEIAGGRMVFRGNDQEIAVATPPVRRHGSTRRYATERLRVTIRRARCEDESEQVRADIVRVVADGIAMEGCGGRVLRPAPAD